MCREGRDHPGAQRFCCLQLLEKLGSAHDRLKLCNYSNAHSESGWVFFLLQKILILTNFIFFQKVTCGQHSCCFPAPLHKQSSVVGGGKWNSRNSFSVSAAASSFREKHVKQKVLFIGMKKNLWKVSKSIHKKMSQSYGHILYCGGERLNSIFGSVFPNITAAIPVWK